MICVHGFLQAEDKGFEQPANSIGKTHIPIVPTHNPTHGKPLPNHQAPLNELISLWPNLSLATQNRIYEIAMTEAAGIVPNASGKRGGK